MGNLRQYLADRLSELRTRKGWTQHDLAAACAGRSTSWVRGYEQKTRWPDPEDLELLAGALGVSAGSLIAEPEPTSPAEALEILGRALARPELPLVWRELVGDFRDLSRDEANDLRQWIEGRREGAKPGYKAGDPRTSPRKPR